MLKIMNRNNKHLLLRTLSISLILLISILITGCKRNNTDSNQSLWEYTKSDVSRFVEGNANLTSQEDDKLSLSFNIDNATFKDGISKDNVLLFDASNIDEVDGYLKYDDVKEYLIDIDDISVSSDLKTINVSFIGDNFKSYGILINKNALSTNTFALGYAPSLVGAKSNIIMEYEETIIKQKGKWSDTEKAIQVAQYLSQIVLGFLADQQIPFAGGIFSLATTLGSAFFSSGATLDSIAKQLDIIDGKIDALGEQIDANQKELLDSLVRTQAMIDEVKVNQYNQNITAYHTDYVKPLSDYIMVYKDSVEQALKRYINEEHIVSLYYGKNEYSDNDLLFASEEDITGANKIDITISAFPNAKEYLKNNKDIVGDGLPNAMYKDIAQAIQEITLPNGRSKEVLIEDIYKTICDNVNYECLSKDDSTLHRDVLQFLNDFVSYAKALAGVNFESVINSYISRLEYIYNFSYEIKPAVIDLLASIKTSLDYYVCLAQTACRCQKINFMKEIADAYDLACDYILNVYNTQKAIPDNYCYIIKRQINANLYNCVASVSFTNLGNHPDFHASFILKKVTNFDGSQVNGTNVDVNSINFVNYSEIQAIVTRYNMLRRAGNTKEDSFIKYLKSVMIVSDNDLNTIGRISDSGRFNERYGQILASFNIRDLTNSDNFSMRCMCYGNPGGSYFNINSLYPYRYNNGTIEADYWSGKMAYGDIINSRTGMLENNKRISAYAKYSESHFLWVDDEHWGLIDDVFGSYFFILSK